MEELGKYYFIILLAVRHLQLKLLKLQNNLNQIKHVCIPFVNPVASIGRVLKLKLKKVSGMEKIPKN
jgi:hypothetical protein